MKYFDKKNRRLIVTNAKADSRYWDEYWKTFSFQRSVANESAESFIPDITKKFLDPGNSTRILEGGCGKGSHVLALRKSGYSPVGIDFAPDTIGKIQTFFPELEVRLGDVRNLPFPDSYFDGYWSLGVIEHFYEGYADIATEMRRVIKDNGYLFITFPALSLLRRIKIKLGLYPLFDESSFSQDIFYQFILPPQKVIAQIEKQGFELMMKRWLDGTKGLMDELSPEKTRKTLGQKYQNSNNFLRTTNHVLSALTAPLSGHIILLVFKKTSQEDL